MNKRKETILAVIGIIVLVLAVIGVSYAAFSYSNMGEKLNSITTGAITMSYTESDNIISITNALPTTDETGKKRKVEGEYFDFTVSTTLTGGATLNWEIAAEDIPVNEKQFLGSNVKFYLTKVTGENEEEVMAPRVYSEEIEANEITGRPANMMSLLTGTSSTSETANYRLRLYVDEAYNPQGDGGNLVFQVKINVYGKTEEQNTGASTLLANYTNDKTITDYNAGDKTKMYTFTHEAGTQQAGWSTEELTDYRYIGKNPNNYITFNNETWRIIGVFTVENQLGEKEQRIKIMRDEEINKLIWDSSNKKWSTASLQQLLNSGDYYNRSGLYAEMGLTEEAKEMIEDAQWYLGDNSFGDLYGAVAAYAFERSDTTASIENTIYWFGKVGLMYPSDYLYTYALGINEACFDSQRQCDIRTGEIPSWIYNGKTQWMITYDKKDYNPLAILSAGGPYTIIGSYDETNALGVRPVVYLKKDINITNGNGSSSNPFSLSL